MYKQKKRLNIKSMYYEIFLLFKCLLSILKRYLELKPTLETVKTIEEKIRRN